VWRSGTGAPKVCKSPDQRPRARAQRYTRLGWTSGTTTAGVTAPRSDPAVRFAFQGTFDGGARDEAENRQQTPQLTPRERSGTWEFNGASLHTERALILGERYAKGAFC